MKPSQHGHVLVLTPQWRYETDKHRQKLVELQKFAVTAETQLAAIDASRHPGVSVARDNTRRVGILATAAMGFAAALTASKVPEQRNKLSTSIAELIECITPRADHVREFIEHVETSAQT